MTAPGTTSGPFPLSLQPVSDMLRTYRDTIQRTGSARMTRMYGPAVRCKRFSSILGDAVLHQCIRLLIGAHGAPSHHGYQRACDLISGQASNGLNGSPVFAYAGKTDPPLSSPPLADLGG